MSSESGAFGMPVAQAHAVQAAQAAQGAKAPQKSAEKVQALTGTQLAGKELATTPSSGSLCPKTLRKAALSSRLYTSTRTSIPKRETLD